MNNWILAFRPKTLTASLVPILVGTSAAYYLQKEFHPWIFVLTLTSALAIQIATNLFNDAIDFKKGADNEKRIGPKRVTQSGLISEKSVWRIAFLFLFIAMAAGIPLVIKGGLPIMLTGLVSVFLAYSYTGGPFPLAYLGLGDLFVIIFFGIIAVAGTAYLQSLQFEVLYVFIGLQIGCLSTILIAINNLRDSDEDKKVGKNTLAVRFGDDFVKGEILVLTFFPFLICAILSQLTKNYKILLPMLALPIAFLLAKKIMHLKSKLELNALLGFSALLHLTFGLLLSLGYFL